MNVETLSDIQTVKYHLKASEKKKSVAYFHRMNVETTPVDPRLSSNLNKANKFYKNEISLKKKQREEEIARLQAKKAARLARAKLTKRKFAGLALKENQNTTNAHKQRMHNITHQTQTIQEKIRQAQRVTTKKRKNLDSIKDSNTHSIAIKKARKTKKD